MKKKLAGLLAALMVLSVGTTVFAADSPNAAMKAVDGAVASDDTVVTVAPVESTDVVESAEDAAVEVAGSGATADVLAVVELKADLGEGGADITISVQGVNAGDKIVILHFTNGKWETITPSKVADGKVTAHFDSLSPVAIVKVTAAAANNNGNTNTNNNSNKNTSTTTTTTTSTTTSTTTNNSSTTATTTVAETSPKTGSAAPVLPVLALVCLAGVVVCGRKVKFNA